MGRTPGTPGFPPYATQVKNILTRPWNHASLGWARGPTWGLELGLLLHLFSEQKWCN